MNEESKVHVPVVVKGEEPLSSHELQRKNIFEENIEEALMSPFKAGEALKGIREEQLYREDYETFSEYCEGRWNLGRRRADQLILASDTLKNLEGCKVLPKNERQIRPLLGLGGPLQKQAWEEAVEKSPKKITGDTVKKVVERFVVGKKRTPKKPTIEIEIQGKTLEDHEKVFDDAVEFTASDIYLRYNDLLIALTYLVRVDRFKIITHKRTMVMMKTLIDLVNEKEQEAAEENE